MLHAPCTPCQLCQPFKDFNPASVHGQEAIEVSESVMATGAGATVTNLGGTDDVTLGFHDLLNALGSQPNEDSIHHRSAPLTHMTFSLLTIS